MSGEDKRVYAPTHKPDDDKLRPFRQAVAIPPQQEYSDDYADDCTDDYVDEYVDEYVEQYDETDESLEADEARELLMLTDDDEEDSFNGFKTRRGSVRNDIDYTRKRLLRTLGAIMALILLTGAVTAAYFVLMVDTITVNGNTRMTADEIVAISGLKTGSNILLQSVDKAKHAIENDPYIAQAAVNRVFPRMIAITVTEREEKAVIPGISSVAVIDQYGYVLTIDSRADFGSMPVVKGMSTTGYSIGQLVGHAEDFTTRTLTGVLKAIETGGLYGSISVIDVSNPLNIRLVTTDGMNVEMGAPDMLDEKLVRLAVIMDKLGEMGYHGGKLMLSASADPVYTPENAAPVTIPDITPAGTLSPDGTPSPADTTPPEETTPAGQTPQVTASAPMETEGPQRTPNPGGDFSG